MGLQFGGCTQRKECGRYPSIGVNNSGTVVEMHQAFGISSLYYSVGKMQSLSVSWGKDHFHCKGDYAKIAINDHGQVVEVHESEGAKNGNLWYCVGKVNSTTNDIEWGDKIYFGAGKYPVVALSNEGKVVIAFEITGFSSETYYSIRKLNITTKKIEEIEGKNNLKLFGDMRSGVTELSIAINGSGYLIVAGREASHKIVYKAGKLDDGTSAITWGGSESCDLDSNYPSVGLDDKGRVISVQQNRVGRNLTYRVGKMNSGGKKVTWHTPDGKTGYQAGCLPAIALSNDGTKIVEEHETNWTWFGMSGNKLFYIIGTLI